MIYLTNAASRRPPFRGTGKVWTIMAAPRPRFGEAGDGEVRPLIPPLEWVRAVKSDEGAPGHMPWPDYRERYHGLLLERLEELRPRTLTAWARGIPLATDDWRRRLHPVEVESGDTLICACGRQAAAEGRCHRVIAADVLRTLGWTVCLDGVVLEPTDR